jgi:hypothetical protein
VPRDVLGVSPYAADEHRSERLQEGQTDEVQPWLRQDDPCSGKPSSPVMGSSIQSGWARGANTWLSRTNRETPS